MTRCPSSTDHGCRCPEHHPGLSVHAADPDAYDRALAPLRGPVRLSVVTAGPDTKIECDGTYRCPCSTCTRQRSILLNTPRPDIRQPWDPRPARAA